MVKRREKTKREIISLDLGVLEKRLEIEDWKNEAYDEIQRSIKPSFAFSTIRVRLGTVQNVQHVSGRALVSNKRV